MLIPFPDLPQDARLWVFPTESSLTPRQREDIVELLGRFVEGWTAHKVPVSGAASILHDQFILVGMDKGDQNASGCSIDALTRAVVETLEQVGSRLADVSSIFFLDGGSDRGPDQGTVRRVDRGTFRKLFADGTVGSETLVFDPSISHVGDLHRFLVPCHQSWHSQLLRAA